MANISFFFPKAKQGGALGINGGLGNMGVSVMQLIAPLAISVSIFAAFGGGGVTQPDGSVLFCKTPPGFGYRSWWSLPWRRGSSWNDLSASKASLRRAAAGAEAWPPVGDGAAVSGDLRLVHRFLRRLCHAV